MVRGLEAVVVMEEVEGEGEEGGEEQEGEVMVPGLGAGVVEEEEEEEEGEEVRRFPEDKTHALSKLKKTREPFDGSYERKNKLLKFGLEKEGRREEKERRSWIFLIATAEGKRRKRKLKKKKKVPLHMKVI